MNKKFEINLLIDNRFETVYISTIIPNVNDVILITEDKPFLVEKRILSIINKEKIILTGKIIQL